MISAYFVMYALELFVLLSFKQANILYSIDLYYLTRKTFWTHYLLLNSFRPFSLKNQISLLVLNYGTFLH